MMRSSESIRARTCFVQRHEPEGGGVDGVADLIQLASAGILDVKGSSSTASVGDIPLGGRGSAR